MRFTKLSYQPMLSLILVLFSLAAKQAPFSRFGRMLIADWHVLAWQLILQVLQTMIIFGSTSQSCLTYLHHCHMLSNSFWCTPLLWVFNFVHLLYAFVTVRLWLLCFFWFHDAATDTAKYSSGDITVETVEGVDGAINQGSLFELEPGVVVCHWSLNLSSSSETLLSIL